LLFCAADVREIDDTAYTWMYATCHIINDDFFTFICMYLYHVCRYYKRIANPPFKMKDVPLDLSFALDIDFLCLKYKRSFWELMVEPCAKRRKDRTPELGCVEMPSNTLLQPYGSVTTTAPATTEPSGGAEDTGDDSVLPPVPEDVPSVHLMSDLHQPIIDASPGCGGTVADNVAWSIIDKLSRVGIGSLTALTKYVIEHLCVPVCVCVCLLASQVRLISALHIVASHIIYCWLIVNPYCVYIMDMF
jgi:hypothetical protein